MDNLMINVVLIITCLVIGFAAGSANKPDQQAIDIMKAKHNINCPLRFYIEDDKLVVKSFSCTLNDMSKRGVK